jgi:hypothetical protein
MNDPWSEVQDGLRDLDNDAANRSDHVDTTRYAAADKRYGSYSEDKLRRSFSV